ncbi:25615_t:CDS:2, partial [Racocetra persica]
FGKLNPKNHAGVDTFATTTEGIFRLSGSAKRIKELQTIFDSPPVYGKTLTWVGYSVHDAANVLRRYLNHLPDKVIPLVWYDKFRAVH